MDAPAGVLGGAAVKIVNQKLLAAEVWKNRAELRNTDDLPPRPRTRAECVNGPRPCPWVGCKHHLFLDVTESGSIQFNFPDRDPDEIPETCAEDVAAGGGITLERVGALMGLTRERVRQVECAAVVKLQEAGEFEDLREFMGRPRANRSSTEEARPRSATPERVAELVDAVCAEAGVARCDLASRFKRSPLPWARNLVSWILFAAGARPGTIANVTARKHQVVAMAVSRMRKAVGARTEEGLKAMALAKKLGLTLPGECNGTERPDGE